MPAKTVVIEDLWKFQGERHELLTPGEYTQLTGRAGRRGIDALGHAVVVYQRQVPFERVAGLAATRTYDLTSSFRPSYNMAVNLVRNYTPEQAHHMLNTSFAQFLADRGVVALERARPARPRRARRVPRAAWSCDLGDFEEYWELRREARRLRAEDRRGRSGRATDGVRARARRADARRRDRRSRKAATAGRLRSCSRSGKGRPTVLTRGPVVLPARRPGLRRAARCAHPGRRSRERASTRSARYRRDVAAALAALHVRPPARTVCGSRRTRRSSGRRPALEARRREHPCHACPDRQRTSGGRSGRTSSPHRSPASTARIRVRTETLARQFDRVLGVLDGPRLRRRVAVTDKGRRLTRIYGEGDILVGEALGAGRARRTWSRRGGRARLDRRVRGSRAHAAAGHAADADGRGAGTSGCNGSGGGSAEPRTSTRCSSAGSSSPGSPRPSTAGRRAGPRGGARGDGDGAGRLRPQLQAADRSAPPDRGRGASRRPPRSSGAAREAVAARRRRVHGRVARMSAR